MLAISVAFPVFILLIVIRYVVSIIDFDFFLCIFCVSGVF